ncbi:MAG: hypothetical protein ACM3JI_06065 [Anaerolineae bacterium]
MLAKLYKIFSLFATFLLYAVSAAEDRPFSLDDRGRQDYEEALALARKNDKALLAVFLGPSGHLWSEKLRKEVLEDPIFIASLEEAAVLVRIEGDLDKVKNRHVICEFPTIVLIDFDEKEMTRVGYHPFSSSDFAEFLKRCIGNYRQLKKVIDQGLKNIEKEKLEELYQNAKELKHRDLSQKILQEGLCRKENLFFLLEDYALLVDTLSPKDLKARRLRKAIEKKDPQNLQGAMLELALIDFRRNARRRKGSMKHPKATLEPLFDYIKTFGASDLENLWKVEMMVAQFFLASCKYTHALKHALCSYHAAPPSHKPQVKEAIDFFQAFVKEKGCLKKMK